MRDREFIFKASTRYFLLTAVVAVASLLVILALSIAIVFKISLCICVLLYITKVINQQILKRNTTAIMAIRSLRDANADTIEDSDNPENYNGYSLKEDDKEVKLTFKDPEVAESYINDNKDRLHDSPKAHEEAKESSKETKDSEPTAQPVATEPLSETDSAPSSTPSPSSTT